ncbi:hypothetical protein AB1Y20_011894 [Prymnesium parvum]|uniref:Uncharacterized protein n=1 Tax=Prymnesium parvum TaxID=97485 RepID=A0AB34IHT1_PRYPA
MDTFAPIVKVWVFPADTSLSQGPLHFAAGSQHNSPGRLRWMHAYSLPPATEAMREPSFRLLGSAAAAAAAPDFIRQTQASMAAVLPLPFASRTLVIADTSGLHHRGQGVVGAVRRSSRLPGDNDGGLPRLHPFRMPHGAAEDAA